MTGPASLSRRLSLAAAAFIAVALVLATVAIGFILHRFVQGQVDQRLDAHVVFLTSLLRTAPDGTIALAGDANGPPFDRPERGWRTGRSPALRTRSRPALFRTTA